MRARKHTDLPVSDRTFQAAGIFARLADSLDRGDLADAAESQKELARLGYVIRIGAESIGQPRLKPYSPSHKANGRGGR
jgi:hypothetical protein